MPFKVEAASAERRVKSPQYLCQRRQTRFVEDGLADRLRSFGSFGLDESNWESRARYPGPLGSLHCVEGGMRRYNLLVPDIRPTSCLASLSFSTYLDPNKPSSAFTLPNTKTTPPRTMSMSKPEGLPEMEYRFLGRSGLKVSVISLAVGSHPAAMSTEVSLHLASPWPPRPLKRA
jgi:hypothetical protein